MQLVLPTSQLATSKQKEGDKREKREIIRKKGKKSYIQGGREGGQLHNVLCVVLHHIVHRKLGRLQKDG